MDRLFLTGLTRAFGGAIVFSLPMLMTMEMWWLGFLIEPLKLALLLLVTLPLLVGMSHFIGFEETFGWKDDLVDAFVAYGVGFAAAAPVLLAFGVLAPGMSLEEIAGKLALQAVPGSIGALLARSQLGGEGNGVGERERRDTYAGEMFFMAAGAVFLSLNVASTEEIVLLSYRMTAWQGLALAVLSLLLMHAFVYAMNFRGGGALRGEAPWWSLFLRFTVTGYGICLAISAYILWTFGRAAGAPPAELVMATVVLAFPAAIGAAAARLIL